MEKSRGTTDRIDRFYGERHARLHEWGWACLFLGALFAFRLCNGMSRRQIGPTGPELMSRTCWHGRRRCPIRGAGSPTRVLGFAEA